MYEEISSPVIERLVRRQEIANEKILEEIGEILGEIGKLTPSEAYTIGQQLKYGESLDKIIKILSRTSQLNEYEIYRMLEIEARKNLDLKKIYFKAKKIDFIPYEKNIPLQNLVNQIARTTLNTYRNISRTTGLTFLDINGNRITRGMREAYSQIVDDAIFNVATGKETFFESLKNQLKTIGQAGVQSIEYESGYHRRIDSALRMNLQDGLNQLAIAQQELVGKQFGYNMVQITHHENSAPDHIDTVDGQQFVKLNILRQQIANGEEKEIKLSDIQENRVKFRGKWYYDFDYINENLKRPVGTLNCYHQIFTAILGVDRPLYSEEELKKDKEVNEKGFEFEGKHFTNYEGQQLLRKVELELRKTRETKIMAKSAGDNDLLNQMKQRENLLVSKYHNILKTSGLKGRLERTRVLTK